MNSDYVMHFKHADDVVKHLNIVIPTITDQLLVQKYVGFVSVVAVTVYELAIKDIFVEFAKKEHYVFGVFVGRHFKKINGRIKLDEIRGEHLKRFGKEYKSQFEENIQNKIDEHIQKNLGNIAESYNTVINARHNFVHGGNIKSTVTYKELIEAYENGKEIIHCLAATMKK